MMNFIGINKNNVTKRLFAVLPMVTLSKLQLRTIEEELKAFKKAG